MFSKGSNLFFKFSSSFRQVCPLSQEALFVTRVSQIVEFVENVSLFRMVCTFFSNCRVAFDWFASLSQKHCLLNLVYSVQFAPSSQIAQSCVSSSPLCQMLYWGDPSQDLCSLFDLRVVHVCSQSVESFSMGLHVCLKVSSVSNSLRLCREFSYCFQFSSFS